MIAFLLHCVWLAVQVVIGVLVVWWSLVGLIAAAAWLWIVCDTLTRRKQ